MDSSKVPTHTLGPAQLLGPSNISPLTHHLEAASLLFPTTSHHWVHCCLQPFFSWMQEVVFDFFLTRALLLSPAPGLLLPPTSCSSLRNLG